MTMTTLNPDQSNGVLITPSQQMIASCSGAIITSLLVTPLDVVKIRLQAQQKPFTNNCFRYCNGLMDHLCPTCPNGNGNAWYKKPVPNFNGTLDAFVKIARTEGITSLWSGLPPTLVMAVPATILYFTGYDQLKSFLHYRHRVDSDWWKPVVAGVTARVLTVICISPLELLRTKLQSEKLTYKETFKAINIMKGQDGVLSLWRGLGPTLLRDVPFSALYWLCYEQAKSYVLKTRGSPNLRPSESFLAGASAGTVAAVLTLPFDVIKTHRQIEIGLSNSGQATSTWQLIGNLRRQQGSKALFTGIVPRIIKIAPACAIMITSYEYLKTNFYYLNQR